MGNFICEVCGYGHDGRCRHRECPKCGTKKDKFKKENKN